MPNTYFKRLQSRINDQTLKLGVIGLGYVGLPLAITAATRGVTTIGLDVDQTKITQIDKGQSYIEAVRQIDLQAVTNGKKFFATTDFGKIKECDVIVICVPTPLTAYREPDLSYVAKTAEIITKHLRKGTLVSLESTTFPGTTADVLTPILEKGGLIAGRDFFVAFSPEREDPGNAFYRTATIPKIVAGDGDEARILAQNFYEIIVDEVVTVSSTRVAEAVKITENIFRAVNIALVNELKVIYEAMGIDVWEVIEGASTKPFGYMPFYPGPGLGGHCIPIDPFYLTWKAREYNLSTRFIELAGEINVNMPKYVIQKLREVLDRTAGMGLNGTRILIIGMAYKKNVSDTRESPSAMLYEILLDEGAKVSFYDPHVTEIPVMRNHPRLAGHKSISLEKISASHYDAVLIATDHDTIDYSLIADIGVPIIDTRNAIERRGFSMHNVTKA